MIREDGSHGYGLHFESVITQLQVPTVWWQSKSKAGSTGGSHHDYWACHQLQQEPSFHESHCTLGLTVTVKSDYACCQEGDRGSYLQSLLLSLDSQTFLERA